MRIAVVGSGAAGVHFAQTALERGHQVEMVDVGFEPGAPVAPAATFPELPAALEDPVRYFLGPDGRHVVYPSPTAKFYGFPPSKQYVFRKPAQLRDRFDSFDPMISYARGGLAEAWTGGSYEYGAADLAAFPFPADDLIRRYDTVARRIGVTAEADDLERYSPRTASYLAPLALDPHSARLTGQYQRHRDAINGRGFHLGRSRVAVLTSPMGNREPCRELGRCLWGCPVQALYAPSATLAVCQAQPGFRYRPGRVAVRFATDALGVIRSLELRDLAGAPAEPVTADLYVLAAGALGSSRIYLETLAARGENSVRLGGLLDNRMAMVPFLTLAMIGRRVELAAYQFHMLAFGITAANPEENAHGQITTLKAASIHPIVQNLPLGLGAGLAVFRRIRAGLAVATLWLHDRRDDGNYLTLEQDDDRQRTLSMVYRASPSEGPHLDWALGRLRAALGRMGAVVPRGMTRVLPHGASVHYGGTLPMAATGGPHTLTPEGRSRMFSNLVVADAAGFPFLPAKNHTFSLMANATRIAETVLP